MNISLEGIAKIYRDDILKLHGVPRKILSDRRPQFASKFIEEFTKALGTKRQLLMAYHSQTDGQTERINQEIEMFLQHYVNYQLDNWTDWLATAKFQYNDKKHAATGKTLFELNFGRHFLERRPYGSNRDSMSREIPYQITKKLGTGN